MSKKINNLYLYLFSISLIYFLLFTAFYFVCFFDKDGLYKLIIKMGTYNNLPFKLSDNDLKNLCSELMKYISLRLPFLETKVTINGVLSDFYSLRSKIHMGDVRNLIMNFRNGCFIAIVICIYTLFKIKNMENGITLLKNAYIKSLIAVFIIICFIIIFASTNFNLFFTKFHEVLFTNDLWLLDPSADYIICLLPEELFMTYGIRIIVAMIIAILLPVLCLHFLSKTQLHQEAK